MTATILLRLAMSNSVEMLAYANATVKNFFNKKTQGRESLALVCIRF